MITRTEKPILICGPTASGKSALGIALAQMTDGVIVNADALQVYANWRILTARPSVEDEAIVPHRLYGHIPRDHVYSVGAWLREVSEILSTETRRVIILGGTGLYFTALTQGLAEIPAVPDAVRQRGNAMRLADGPAAFIPLLDADTLAKTDQNNAMRLQRAWEVQKATGRSLVSWQSQQSPPILLREETVPIALKNNTNWLNSRIEKRFDIMLKSGAMEEVEANRQDWDPSLPSSKALGAAELMAYLDGEITLSEARERAVIATRQFAKRQRTWVRNKMADWKRISLDNGSDTQKIAEDILKIN